MTIILTTKMIIGIVVGVLGLMFCGFLFGVAFVIDYERKASDRAFRTMKQAIEFERTGVVIKFEEE